MKIRKLLKQRHEIHYLWNTLRLNKLVYKSRWRPTRAELEEICRKGEELLFNATPDEMKQFREWK